MNTPKHACHGQGLVDMEIVVALALARIDPEMHRSLSLLPCFLLQAQPCGQACCRLPFRNDSVKQGQNRHQPKPPGNTQ
ncbi:MAG: hypothetical protein ACO3PV_02965 [Pseudohongiellaceae bacterium]